MPANQRISGYFQKVVCHNCRRSFFPLMMSGNNDLVLMGKIPLISKKELYCTVEDMTDEEWNEWKPDEAVRRINRIKSRSDLVFPVFQERIYADENDDFPGFEEGIYFQCIHCKANMVRASERLSIREYLKMGGKLDFRYELSAAESMWKPLRNLGMWFLLGAGLLASVWNVKGWVGGVVGGLGLLIMIGALAGAKHSIGKRLKDDDEDDSDPFQFTLLPEVIQKFEDQQLTRRIQWISGLTAAFGFLAILLNKKFTYGSDFPLIFNSLFALTFFAVVIWASAEQSEKATFDFGWLWKNDARFRSYVWLFGCGMVAGVLSVVPFSKANPFKEWRVIPGIVIFFASAIGLAVMVHKRRKWRDPAYQNWTVSQKKMDNITIALLIICLFLMQIMGTTLLANFVQELRFSVIFFIAGVPTGYLLVNFLKAHFTDLFKKQTDARWLLELRVYVIGMLLTLFLAAAYNRQTAWQSTFYKTVRLTERDEKKLPIEVEYDGKIIGLFPGEAAWKLIAGADSVRLFVGKGALGFDYVLGVEQKQ